MTPLETVARAIQRALDINHIDVDDDEMGALMDAARAALDALADIQLPEHIARTDSGLIESEFSRICEALSQEDK